MTKILLLEDDMMIASGLVYALNIEGYEVIHCQNVADALMEAEAKSFGLAIEILLDISNQSVHIEHDVKICCDKRWTTEALTNIMKNAMEHSLEGSVITIDSGSNPMYEWISVTDSGSGLSKAQYAAMLKRFENSTNENGFGIGVPLAISIMKGQNGDIDVELGGNGKGATFILKFFK